MTKTKPETSSKDKSKRWKYIVSIVTLIAMIVLVIAIRDEIVETYQNLGRVNYWVLLLMPIFQLGNYHAYVQMYRALLSRLGEHIRYKSMFRVQLELNFVNNVFPSGGVSGISYFGLRMRDADVRPGKSTLVQVMKFVLVFLSFQILLAIGLLLLTFSGGASNFLIMITAILSTLLLVGTVLLAYILDSKQRMNSFFTFITKMLNKFIHNFRRSHPETIKIEKVRELFDELHESYMVLKKNPKSLKRPLMFALLANITEVLTIYTVYVAFGEFVNPGAVIIAYAVANFAGLISVLPGGVGVYEALMTAVLVAAGIPAALSLPVTVMYRILNSFIQLIPGYYFYQKNLHRAKITPEDFAGDGGD
jgi:uncharacterized protein (TIRG00374 family)